MKGVVTLKLKLTILLVLLYASPVFSQCDPNWKTGNGPQGVSNYVTSVIKWDPDGNGPQSEQLVIGGYFTSVTGVPAHCAAIWDGNTWKPMGGGLPSYTRTFAVYNGQLFAVGNYAGVYRWNGSNWERLDGSDLFLVDSMTVYNNKLIIGETTSQGCNLYSWDGNEWQQMSSMTSGTYITALTVYNGELIAGGSFTDAGGVDCNRIAQWDGYNWHPMGDGTNGTVKAFTIYNNELIIGGGFTSADGMDVNRVVRWNGTNYYPMGQGLTGNPGYWWTQDVQALTVYKDKLIVGGGFYKAGDLDVNKIASWDGNSWQSLGSGASETLIRALVEYNGELIVGGDYSKAGGITVNGLGRWDGSQWRAFGNGLGGNVGSNDSYEQSLTVYNNELVATGVFTTAGGIDVNEIARWNGDKWQKLGSGLGGSSYHLGYALTVYNGDLIAGGQFTRAGDIDANSIARWDGSNWYPLGTGFGVGISMPNNPQASVRSLTVFNGQLIAGGDFNLAGGVDANGIAAWDGSNWHAIGDGIKISWQGVTAYYGVRALTVYKGDLIAGGDFNNAGGIDVHGIMRWDGQTWQPMGGGIAGTRPYVAALMVYDGNLIVGGNFTKAGGIGVNYIASWDGNSWQPMGNGFNSTVYTLTIYDGQLIAGGSFASPKGIARWDGSSWQPFGSGMEGVTALTSFHGDLIAGGWFAVAGGIPSVYWARWGVPEPKKGDLNHDCFVDWLDLYWLVERWLDDDCLYTGWCYEADLNYDLKVDFEDFAEMATKWNPPVVGDFSRDGKVDINDLAILAGYWLQNVPQADIAPPGGDNVVNFLDFAAFAANWN
ncbi:MAG: hypothetical protein ABSH16_01495 [Sedimentisphaerales bacterium]